MGNKKGLIGFECKYTDTFSFKPAKSNTYYGDEGNKNYDAYSRIIYKSKASFAKPYLEFVRSKEYNQLFRNELIARALMQNNEYDFVRTGLFCYQEDNNAISSGNSFMKMLSNTENFKIITYSDFISNVQKLNLDWRQLEWTMLLWARYCAVTLSNDTVSNLK